MYKHLDKRIKKTARLYINYTTKSVPEQHFADNE